MQKHLNPKPIWNPGPLPGNHPDKQKTSDTLPLALGCMPHWILGYSTNKQNYCQHRFLFLSFWATPLNTTNSWSKVFWPHVKVSSLWQGSNVKSQSWLSNWDSWRGKGLIHFLNCCSFCSELSGFCLNRHLLSYSWQTQYQHHSHPHLHRHHFCDHHNPNHHPPVQVFLSPNGNILSYLWPNAWPFTFADTPKSYKTYHDIFELENTSSAVMIMRKKYVFLSTCFFTVFLGGGFFYKCYLCCFPIAYWHRWLALCIGDDINIVGASQWICEIRLPSKKLLVMTLTLWEHLNESVKLGCPPRNYWWWHGHCGSITMNL